MLSLCAYQPRELIDKPEIFHDEEPFPERRNIPQIPARYDNPVRHLPIKLLAQLNAYRLLAFYPERDSLNQTIKLLHEQVDQVLIVDNTPPDGATGQSGPLAATEYLPLGANRGIARAQNEGIHWAQQQGFGFVLLMDQDSLPATDMVQRLLDTHHALTDRGIQVAAGTRGLDQGGQGAGDDDRRSANGSGQGRSGLGGLQGAKGRAGRIATLFPQVGRETSHQLDGWLVLFG